ncbi:MAG: TIGR00725 family protein [Candidatus Hodarchaeota archaeon]
MNIIPMIGVIGDSEIDCQDLVELAYKIGQLIAKKGAALVCGGRTGVMEFACKGAFDAGGLTIAILPTHKKSDANSFCKIRIPTGLGWARNSLVVLASDVVIAIGGKSGTLSEIAYAWMYEKPIIALTSKLVKGWSTELAGKKIDDRRDNAIIPADSAEKAIDIAFKIIEKC